MGTRIASAATLMLGLTVMACAPEIVKIDQSTRDSLRRVAEIKVVHYFPPDLQVQGAGLVGYGPSAGAAAAIQTQAQNQAAHELAIEDPVLRIKSHVSSSLTKILATNNLTPVPTPLQELQVDKLKGIFPQGTVLDFATTYWGVMPLPYNPFELVLYRARARLLKFPEGELLWQGRCDLESDDSAGMPSDKTAVVTRALLVSNTLNRLADRCSEQLVAQFSGTDDSE
ncbi:hypothetical protein YTPLAS18_02650 [Nitrospira sp.]|nr:hypothetical protein YTPLAS18_02650 [Nitrospira sp.]